MKKKRIQIVISPFLTIYPCIISDLSWNSYQHRILRFSVVLIEYFYLPHKKRMNR